MIDANHDRLNVSLTHNTKNRMAYTKKSNTDPEHLVRVNKVSEHFMVPYKYIANSAELKQKYLNYGHHSNAVYSDVDQDELAMTLRVCEDPLVDAKPETLKKIGYYLECITSPQAFLKYALLLDKVKDDAYINMMCRTYMGVIKLKFHPEYGVFEDTSDEETAPDDDNIHYEISIGDYRISKPMERIQDFRTKEYFMILEISETNELLKTVPQIELEPEVIMLKPEHLEYYLYLLRKHRMTLLKNIFKL